MHIARELEGYEPPMTSILAMLSMIPAVALLAIGPLIDRFGPRKIMLTGILLAGVGFGSAGLDDHIFALLIPHGLITLGAAMGLLLPVQTAVANWFAQRRSIALALVSAAAWFGWRYTKFLVEQIEILWTWPGPFLWLGVALLAIGLPLALLIRHKPETSGCLPDGRPMKTIPAVDRDAIFTA